MFSSVNLHHQDESILILSSNHKYVHLKTYWTSHTMHQNLAIILQQFNYGKNSFIVLIPDACDVTTHHLLHILLLNFSELGVSHWVWFSYLNEGLRSSFESGLNLSIVTNSSDALTSVTRWIDYFSIFGHLQQWKLAKKRRIIAKLGSAFSQKRNKLAKNRQRLVNFCQSGEISPNLVTLALTYYVK